MCTKSWLQSNVYRGHFLWFLSRQNNPKSKVNNVNLPKSSFCLRPSLHNDCLKAHAKFRGFLRSGTCKKNKPLIFSSHQLDCADLNWVPSISIDSVFETYVSGRYLGNSLLRKHTTMNFSDACLLVLSEAISVSIMSCCIYSRPSWFDSKFASI